ncbi:maleylacetate reductase [Vibrio cincinnatiensis]|uniref:maleylacetate reductase n=1 Tax=Vibrio cincinnatiensis TaxID=675 RepID=UPI001EDF3F9A|nr:maleylacetate reductase [Vibrio cincinnatiensis]MCG3742789.1 maleylacetate reductase [Vibrio cincinnatiensis]
MMDFMYQAMPIRVIFGIGKIAETRAEVEKLGIKRALVLATPQQADLAHDISERLGDIAVGIYDQAVMHVPSETVNDVMEVVKELQVDGGVAVGGGSTIGLAKAIALKTELPILTIPTTYAGSEMTPVWGITHEGIKTTGRDVRVLAKTVIYDPELTVTLPNFISGPSGMNAIAHCVEGLYAENRNPIISLLAEEGIRALGQNLVTVVEQPQDRNARSQALYGAWLSGTVLGNVGMAIHHKLCHTLGGSFNLPHAEVHTVMIPQVVNFNKDHAPQAMAAIGRALNVVPEKSAAALYELAKQIGAPIALKDIGMLESDLDKAAEIATKNPYYNPRPADYSAVRELLEKAYWGVKPE